jgi:hypothetical protein
MSSSLLEAIEFLSQAAEYARPRLIDCPHENTQVRRHICGSVTFNGGAAERLPSSLLKVTTHKFARASARVAR